MLGTDISSQVLRKASANAASAKVNDMIIFRQADFFETDFGSQKKYTIITNPPYGERMQKNSIDEMYKKIGDTLKHKYKGSNAWIISSNIEAFKHVGLRTSRKVNLYNGGLPCKFCKYEMY
jgi:putative N6-adenine-specific DNA methylase